MEDLTETQRKLGDCSKLAERMRRESSKEVRGQFQVS